MSFLSKAVKIFNPVQNIVQKVSPKIDAKVKAELKPGQVAKIMVNPLKAAVSKFAPNSKLAKKSVKVDKTMTEYNPANVFVDMNKAITAGSLNVANRVLTGNRTTKGFSTGKGKSFLSKKTEKLVYQGDNWMTTSKAGQKTTAVTGAVVAAVGVAVPVVGLAVGAVSIGMAARNKVVDKQKAKRELKLSQEKAVNSQPYNLESQQTYNINQEDNQKMKLTFIEWLLL